MSDDRPVLLLVDDDDVYRSRLGRALSERGFEVFSAGSTSGALAQQREHAPELAVIDLRMPGGSGLELLRELRAHDPTIRVLVLTGYGSIPSAIEATRLGAIGYVSKPVDADELLRALLGGQGADAGAGGETPSLARAEWEHIQRVLADSEQNISEAARRLGIHRRSLQRKLSKRPPRR